MGRTGNIYSVNQVNSYVRNMFLQDFMLRSISVRGELSNVKYHSSGHIYFTLKDAKSSMSCVMFAGSRGGLKCQLNEGMQVVVEGSVDVYERDGRYQLYAREIAKDGMGALYERFLAMKQEMEEMGMFAPEYKQPIPAFVKTLGVVTAPTGAAIQDIINIAKRRNPYIQIVLYPAIVQGEAAKESVARGIRALERYGVDVMIVGRGGGSMEDLWAFNEPEVAQAIFDCSVPIVSAVGHETDTTIADYVADLRAPTPSAAAELCVCDIGQIKNRMDRYRESLTGAMERKCRMQRMRLQNYGHRLKLHSPAGVVKENRMRLLQLEERYGEAMQRKLTLAKHRQMLLLERYKGASPLNKLGHGYAYVESETGKPVRDAEMVQVGEQLTIHLANGLLEAEVTKREISERRQV